MMTDNRPYYSKLEEKWTTEGFLRRHEDERIPIVEVDSYPILGQFVALRFIEWAQRNPKGVVSLPTGKTPEYFLRWMHHIIGDWDHKDVRQLRKRSGLESKMPDLAQLYFVQSDEFFPLPSHHPKSFISFIRQHYLDALGFRADRAILMDFEQLPWPEKMNIEDIFPDQTIDLSLRTRIPDNDLEEIQREALIVLDTFALKYEQKIRDLGGMGFFLGDVGPDGNVAFNVRGSDFYSTTRLTYTNFETQAASAADLGGIENSARKAVMTIGLGTLSHNPDTVAILMAAGEAKAGTLAGAVTQPPTIVNPASILQKMAQGRMYITSGASVRLAARSLDKVRLKEAFDEDDIVRAVMHLSLKYQRPLIELTDEQITGDPYCRLILDAQPWKPVQLREAAHDEVLDRLKRGSTDLEGKRFLHTGPHHDDILLGYLPSIVHQVRSDTNSHDFAVMTSGFTSVPNSFIQRSIQHALEYMRHRDFHHRWKSGYFSLAPEHLRVQDAHDFLNGVVSNNRERQDRCVARRLIRAVMDTYGATDEIAVRHRLKDIFKDLATRHPGEKDQQEIQVLKGVMREFEEDLAWGHYGFDARYVHHMRLAFYKGDYFAKGPSKTEDIPPIAALLKKVRPDILTLAFDPEASGPDTHYKVLQVLTAALEELPPAARERLEIWGYRNVWHRFNPGEANIYVPVSINSIATMDHIFKTCYLTQRDASFPSYEHNGPFSELVQRIFVAQFQVLKTALGADFWLESKSPRLRATQGILFMRHMKFDNLQRFARTLRASAGEEP